MVRRNAVVARFARTLAVTNHFTTATATATAKATPRMALIVQTYGIFWERANVDFGTKGLGNKGVLIGHSDMSKTKTVDFELQRGIYIL